jgi:hypothetical protein
MRLMANLTFANGARGFFSRAYHNDPIWVTGSCQRSLTGPFLTFSDLWLELDRRMERFQALTPLLLSAKPDSLPDFEFMTCEPSTQARHPDWVDSTATYLLRGDDFEIFFLINNDVRGMSSVNLNIPTSRVHKLEIYGLSDFVERRTWEQMDLERHIEMFPGQGHVVIVASPDVCADWRDVLARRLMEDDRRQLAFNLRLARAYNLDVVQAESLMADVRARGGLQDLLAMDLARDILLDMTYACRDIAEPRGKIISASSAVCACDGALCRLMAKGKIDLAQEWGLKVVPMAREIAMARIKLRQGDGGAIIQHCNDLARRAVKLVSEIRDVS